MIRYLIIKNRSYRRFDETIKIEQKQIESWIELARFSASGRNMQPLKYAIVTDQKKCDKIFPNTGWAGYLKDWRGPEEGERPVAYVAVVHDTMLADGYFCDDGIAMQSILLGAVEDGFGGCMIGSFNKNKVAKILKLPDHMKILWLIALGKPAESCKIEEAQNGEIKYYRDENGVHHVPKRPLNELLIN